MGMMYIYLRISKIRGIYSTSGLCGSDIREVAETLIDTRPPGVDLGGGVTIYIYATPPSIYLFLVFGTHTVIKS